MFFTTINRAAVEGSKLRVISTVSPAAANPLAVKPTSPGALKATCTAAVAECSPVSRATKRTMKTGRVERGGTGL